jgi:hypothetical protein
MPATEMRKTAVDVVGDAPWGTHFRLFHGSGAIHLVPGDRPKPAEVHSQHLQSADQRF